MPPRNGHKPPPRRMPVRTVRVELDGDYDGFSLTMRSNPPLRVFTTLQAGPEFETLRDTLRSLIVDWDFVDEQGEPLEVGDVESLSIELFGLIVERYMGAIAAQAAVPKG